MLQQNVKTRLLSFLLMFAMLFSMVGTLPMTVAKAAESNAYIEVKMNGAVLNPVEEENTDSNFDKTYKIEVPEGTTDLAGLEIRYANPDPNAEKKADTIYVYTKDDNRLTWGEGGAVSGVQLGQDNYLKVTVGFSDYTEEYYKVYFEEAAGAEEPDQPTVDPNAPAMAITDEDLNANQYETYYWADGINYTYKDQVVTFVDESSFKAGDQTYTLKNKKTEVSVETAEDGSVTVSLTNLAVPVGSVSGAWNSTFDGTVQMVYQTDIAGQAEVRSADGTNITPTLTFTGLEKGTYHLTGGTIYERANEWSPGIDFGNGAVKENTFGVLPDITFTVGASTEAPEGYIGTKTEAKVYDDFQNDIWLQFQQKALKVGETVDIYPKRVEQIVSDVINNDVQRPNFHFEVIQGQDVVDLSVAESTDKSVATAKAPGTAIVKVTYDAVDYRGKTWGAISDVNTGYAVITVGEEGAATIESSIDDWRHYDTIYYNEGETTPYTFDVKTENAESVKVTCNGIEVAGDNGKYTANLENRANIIGIVATDKDGKTTSTYRVIDARFIEVVVANKTDANRPLAAGDTANISFKGITMPVYKLATIYNPQFGKNSTAVLYHNDKLGDFEGKCGQWDLATNNDFDVTFDAAGDYTFTSEAGKAIRGTWWGDALGSDLDKEGQGDPNLNAATEQSYFSTMPSFTVSVGTSVAVDNVTLDKTALNLSLNESAKLTATVAPENATHPQVIWTSSDEKVATVDGEGNVKAVGSGKAEIKATADGKEAVCTVTVTAGTVEEVDTAIANLPAADKMTLRDKAAVEYARQLYNNLNAEDQAKVADLAKLEAAEAKLEELIQVPYLFSLDGKILNVVTEEANSYRGHYYKVEVPKGTEKIQLERYKNIEVQDQSYATLIPEGQTTVDIETANRIGKGSYFILNYDMFWYDYIYFEEVDAPAVEVESIKMTPQMTGFQVDMTMNVVAKVAPVDAADQNLTWKAEDESIVGIEVSEDTHSAKLTGLKPGDTKIHVTASNGVEGVVSVSISVPTDVYWVRSLIQDLPKAENVTLDDEAAIQEAREAYDALPAERQEWVGAEYSDKLAQAEQALEDLKANQQAVQAVIDQIDALKPADELTLDDKTAVEAAQKAYDALTDGQKAQVTNADALKAARDKIAELEKAAADQQAAQAVIDQIDALGEITSLDQKAAVEAAQKAYDALTDTQKALVTNADALKAAQDKIAELEKAAADQQAAQAVIDQIDALGEITSLDQKAAVEAAQKAYDALTDTQKALVTNADALKAAQDKIAELEQGQTPDPEPTPEPTPNVPGGNAAGGAGVSGNQTEVGTQTTTASGNANTGVVDNANVFYGAAALMAVAALGAVVVLRRRKHN